MKRASQSAQSKVIKILKAGGVGVLATDTIYGLVGSALKRKTVERIFKVRKRSPKKPLIILISSVADLKKFGIVLDVSMKKVLHELWPGKVSVILPCHSVALREGWPCTVKRFAYLHRGKKSLAFRLPRSKKLHALLARTGPLVAPSANPEGLPAARTLKEARHYFGDSVDFYMGVGKRESKPSTLISFKSGEVEVLREGAVNISKIINR